MKTPPIRLLSVASAILMAFCGTEPNRLAAAQENRSVVEGKVQDAQTDAVAGVTVSLQGNDLKNTLTFTSDSAGQFRFEVPPGSYTLRAKRAGYLELKEGPFVVPAQGKKSFVLVLKSDPTGTMAFSDEPSFTVAGVTDTTALGGHGSGPVMRNSNTLSKETASLAKEGASPSTPAGASAASLTTQETAIRAKLSRTDSADLRAALAEIEETEGHPVDAVKDYQRAAEMQPTEPHLFAWGAELLLHHAPAPAIEVFTKAQRLYPQSSRVLLGLGAAHYAQRSADQAVQIFMKACDLNPADPTPYLFLGKLQVTEQVLPAGWTERMKRFVSLHPDNATAHYLYAVGLMKSEGREAYLKLAEAELNGAIKLDPHLGDAYLYLGILLNQRQDFPGAAAALQKAVENTPTSEEAHYRLAQVYRRMGETEKVSQEIAQYQKLLAQRDEEIERERHEIPQFVYTLRNQTPSPQPAVSTPQ
jgi:tetratricopeptide (TPR) repeat protein